MTVVVCVTINGDRSVCPTANFACMTLSSFARHENKADVGLKCDVHRHNEHNSFTSPCIAILRNLFSLSIKIEYKCDACRLPFYSHISCKCVEIDRFVIEA